MDMLLLNQITESVAFVGLLRPAVGLATSGLEALASSRSAVPIAA
jgi:hypothetical protein